MTTQPTSEMIEAVAQAIYEQHGKQTPWLLVREQHKALWRGDAKAAIAAMGELTAKRA